MIDFTKIDAGELNRAIRSAHDEIMNLRNRLAEAEPKAHAYDTISQMARLTIPPDSQGYGEDAAWMLKSILDRAHGEDEKAVRQPDGVEAAGWKP